MFYFLRFHYFIPLFCFILISFYIFYILHLVFTECLLWQSIFLDDVYLFIFRAGNIYWGKKPVREIEVGVPVYLFETFFCYLHSVPFLWSFSVWFVLVFVFHERAVFLKPDLESPGYI